MPQYQGVWTLEQQAQALTNQQWVTDPNFKNTTLLLQADGTGSGSQNQTFLDGSTNNFFITRNGNTTQGSFSPFSQAPGYWGNYFNGSGSGPYLRFGSSAALTFGTGDFTIEFWVYFVSINDGTVSYLYDLRDANGTGSFFVEEPANTWTYRDGAGNLVTTGMTSTTFAANQWYHVAVCRASGVINFYINGVKVSSNPTDTSNYATSYISIMSRHLSDGANNNTNSYTSNFRVVKGTAVYTANFTPQTTPLTAITNTSLLTCQSNRFVDNSASPLTVTVDTGQPPSVQAFGPFAPALQWTPDVVGGSGYYDGSGDYLTYPPGAGVAFGTGDFTVEFWIYPTASISQVYLMDARNSGQTSSWAIGFNLNNTGAGQFTFFNGVAGTAYNESSQSCVLNQWNHCVAVRSGTTFSLFTNGTRVYTTTNSTNYSSSQTLSYIARGQGTGSEFYYTGYMVSNRIVKGTAVYSPSATTLTVPTAPLTAITNTQLLLGCTNAGIYDGKMANNLETVGNAQVATSPVKYGSGSMYFNGSSSILIDAPLNALLSPEAGQFTYECWLYPLATPTNGGLYSAVSTAVSTQLSIQYYSNTGVGVATGSAWIAYTAVVPPLNTWTHIAITRDATNSIRIFFNGIAQTLNAGASTAITSTQSFLSTAQMQLGLWSGVYFNGYMDEFRFTKGVARYIANFTPPQQALPRQ